MDSDNITRVIRSPGIRCDARLCLVRLTYNTGCAGMCTTLHQNAAHASEVAEDQMLPFNGRSWANSVWYSYLSAMITVIPSASGSIYRRDIAGIP